jgi:hypothetical protein
MSAGAFDLHRRSSRAVWAWCVVYTVLAPPLWRSRRREELRGHLWEAEQAGHGSVRVLRAALAGVVADLSWALGRGLPSLGRAFGTTTPYLVIAGAFPIQAAVVASLPRGPQTGPLVNAGAFGGGAALLVAGTVALIHRHRSRR